eukprot:g38010.t1
MMCDDFPVTSTTFWSTVPPDNSKEMVCVVSYPSTTVRDIRGAVLCLLWASQAAADPAKTPPPRYFTLSPALRQQLAEVINIAFDADHAEVEDSEHEQCLFEIVSLVDARFTATAPASLKQHLWTADTGCEKAESDRLSDSLRRQLLPSREPKAEQKVEQQKIEHHSELPPSRPVKSIELSSMQSCAYLSDDEYSDLVARAITALTKACLPGRTAFLTSNSVPDRVLSMIFPGQWSTVGFVGILCIAAASTILSLCLALQRLLVWRKKVPCQCRLCKGFVEVLDRIGEGGYGDVYMCRQRSYRGTKSEKAVIKIIEVDTQHNINDIQDAMDEAIHLVRLKHPNVVSYKDAFIHRNASGTDFVCIVMELCESGSLFDIVSDKAMTFTLLLRALGQVIAGLAYTHAQGIVHADVKLDNMFVVNLGKDMVVKVGDFGLAVKLHVGHISRLAGAPSSPSQQQPASTFISTVGGTPCFQAPEIFRQEYSRLVESSEEDEESESDTTPLTSEWPQNRLRRRRAPVPGKPGSPVDVWGVGCLLYEAALQASVPDSEPFLGQIALDRRRWKRTLRKLSKKLSLGLNKLIQRELALAQPGARPPSSPEEEDSPADPQASPQSSNASGRASPSLIGISHSPRSPIGKSRSPRSPIASLHSPRSPSGSPRKAPSSESSPEKKQKVRKRIKKSLKPRLPVPDWMQRKKTLLVQVLSDMLDRRPSRRPTMQALADSGIFAVDQEASKTQ